MEATRVENGKERRATRWLTVASFVLAALVTCSFAFTPLRTSNDEFWHLKTGKWIAENRTLPQNDIFTYTAEKIPWHNHEWLAQIAMWKIYQFGEWGKANLWDERSEFGGWGMIILVKSIFVVLAYAGLGMLAGWRMRRPEWAALAAAMAAALARRTFYPRPPVITYLLLGMTLWMMIEWREGRLRSRWLWLLAPLFALWSNLHGGWQAGLVVIGAFWADAAWNILVAWMQSGKTNQPLDDQLQISNFKFQIFNSVFHIPRSAFTPLALLTGLGVACLLASGLNPSGFHLFELTARVMSDRYLVPRLSELQPPDWRYMWIAEGVTLVLAAAALRPARGMGLTGLGAMLAITAAVLTGIHFAWWWSPSPWLHLALTLSAVAGAILRSRRPGGVAHLLLIAFFTYQGYMHVRHLTLMAVVLLPTLAWALEAWVESVTVCLGITGTRDLRDPKDEKDPSERAGRVQADRYRWLESAVALCVLGALAGLWFFDLPEKPSYSQRNRMLAGGMEIQPMMVNAQVMEWPAPSRLPRGIFYMDAYPVKAVDFLIRAGLPGRLWNGGNYAGYLMWRLSPEKYKVFTDNRYDIFGSLFLREEHSVINGWSQEEIDWLIKNRPGFFAGPPPPPWDKVLDKYNVQTVFIEAGEPGNRRFAKEGWVRVWEDYDFNIWVRDTPANKAAIERALAMPRPVTAWPVAVQ